MTNTNTVTHEHAKDSSPLTLVQFPSPRYIANYSPFCMRVEVWLKIANVPYEVKNATQTSTWPKGKLPVVIDNGKMLADSELIIDALIKAHNIELDTHLTQEEIAKLYALEALFTEKLYWIVLYFRWQDPEGWALLKKAFFGRAPSLLKNFIANRVRKNMLKELYMQGMGRHSKQEILQFAHKTFSSISATLANKPYFAGEKVASIDATAYAFLANCLYSKLNNEITAIIKHYPNLVNYCQRMKEQYGN